MKTFLSLAAALIFFLISISFPENGKAETQAVLKGKVTDAEGLGVEGANIFIYNSPDVRRPADFISARTGKDGVFRMTLPPGQFWIQARLKKIKGYGPLMQGDKHSGEPKEIELVSGSELEVDFTLKDLKDASAPISKMRQDYVRLQGRIVDVNGLPVEMAYAIAGKKEKVSGVPDFVSAWTGPNGLYTIYLPRGKYFLGAALSFPPDPGFFLDKEICLQDNASGVDLVIKTVQDGL